jgi:hypothetical protein
MIPVAVIKNGYVEGRHYERKKLIEGESGFSNTLLPQNKDKFERNTLEFVKEKYLTNNSTVILNIEELLEDSLSNSYFNNPILIYEPNSLLLEHNSFSGNIILIAEQDIVISKNCELNNVLLYAKSIYIEEDFQGSLQCIAKDSLITGKNCSFTYPSNLVLLNKEPSFKKAILKLGEGSKIEGALVTNIVWTDRRYKPDLFVEENTSVHGQIYSNGSLQLKGNVYGTVFCDEFILRKPSAIYINHLLDIEIDISKLHADFVGVNFTKNTRPLKIAKKLF